MKFCGNISKLRHLIVIVLLGAFTACSSSSSNNSVKKENWALDLANAVMSRNDSLAIYNNPASVKWTYDLGMLGQAIEKVNSSDSRYFNYNKNFIDLFVNENGSISTYKSTDFNLDDFCPAKSLLDLYQKTGDEKYSRAIDTIMLQLKNQPRTSNGGYCHKRIYDHQIWLNSSYMLEPFLAQYAHDFNQPQWYDTICFQLINTYNLTVDSNDGLMVHAWDETRKQNWADPVTGKSPNKWGRGMGYYAMALVDVLAYLPKDHPERKELETMLKDISKSLLKVRDKSTGLWFQILDKGDKEYNYIESSCSAMFIYAFAKGVNLGILPEKYKEIASESFLNLAKNCVKTDVDQLPTLTHISGPAGLGIKVLRDGSFEYYINQQQIDNDPKGVAPLIMAAVELNL